MASRAGVRGRPEGSKNKDFDAKRAMLVHALRRRLSEPDGARASFRELAAAADVSPAALRHYFPTREAAIGAVLDANHAAGIPYLHAVAAGELRPFRASVEWLLGFLSQGLTAEVADMHAFGLAAGLRDAELGPSYVNELLEPTLQAVEARLARHVAAGDMRRCDTRVAALALVAPLLLATLHQGALGGRKCRPLDLDRMRGEHVEAFVRAYAAKPREKAPAQ